MVVQDGPEAEPEQDEAAYLPDEAPLIDLLPRALREVPEPTQAEREARSLCHWPYAPWCRHC
eukprot:14597291-Alexandrium_andersonii.AAC.1